MRHESFFFFLKGWRLNAQNCDDLRDKVADRLSPGQVAVRIALVADPAVTVPAAVRTAPVVSPVAGHKAAGCQTGLPVLDRYLKTLAELRSGHKLAIENLVYVSSIGSHGIILTACFTTSSTIWKMQW